MASRIEYSLSGTRPVVVHEFLELDNFLFSGYQYNWIMVYEPGASYPPANNCGNLMGAEADSAWVGLIYMPSAALSYTGSSATSAVTSILVDTLSMVGTSSISSAPSTPWANMGLSGTYLIQ